MWVQSSGATAWGGFTRGAKVAPRILDVERNLLAQRFEIGKALLVAQLVQEFHAHMRTVNLAVEIEQVHLERGLAARIDRRTDAEARRAEQRLRADAAHAYREDPE